MKTFRKVFAGLGIAASFFLLAGVAYATSVLQGYQGGTGFGPTTTPANVGSFLQVASSSPVITYKLSQAVSGTGTPSYVARFTATSTLGTGVLYDNGTNVGIGTTNPANKLTVGNTSSASGQGTNPIAMINGLNNTTFNGGMLGVYSTNTATADYGGSIGFGGNYVGTSNSIDFGNVAGRLQPGTTDGGYLAFSTRGDTGSMTEAMRINDVGNVVIGTVNSIDTLTVGGAGTGRVGMGQWTGSNAYAAIYLNGGDSISGNYNILSSSVDPTLYLNRPTGYNISFQMNNANQMMLASNGYLSVGYGGPGLAPLHIQGVTDPTAYTSALFEAGTSGYGSQLWFTDGFTYNYTFGTDPNGDLTWNSGRYAGYPGTETMRLTQAGRLGIGTNPLTKLDVSGTGINLTGTAYVNSLFTQDHTTFRGTYLGYDSADQTGVVAAGTSGASSNIAFWTYNGIGWAEKMRITGSGNVGIGTTTPPATLTLDGANATAKFKFCLELNDSVSSSTIEYVYSVSGTLTESSTKPAFCQ